jgi:hypothetical protein
VRLAVARIVGVSDCWASAIVTASASKSGCSTKDVGRGRRGKLSRGFSVSVGES